MKNAFNWDINKTDIVDIHGNVISGYNNITRNDSGKTIAVMKDSYHPMTTQQFTETAEEVAAQIGGKVNEYQDWETSTSNMGAARPVITAQIELTDPLEIAGSKIEGKLTLGVGFDGSRSFFIGHTSRYLRCSNEFASIVKDFTSRLTKNNMVRVEEIIKNITLYREYEEELYENFRKFQEVKVDDKIIDECIARLVKLTDEERLDPEAISTQKRNKMYEIAAGMRTECAELGENAWGMFNGVTYYTTHVYESKAHEEYNRLFGARKEMNHKTLDFCKELLEG